MLTCVQLGAACEEARVAAGLPAAPVVTADVPAHADLAAGQLLHVTVTGVPQGRAELAGTCIHPTGADVVDSAMIATTVVPAPVPRPCTVSATIALGPGSTHTTTWTFNDRLRTFTLAATGDILIHEDVTAHARQPDGRLDFGVLLGEVAPVISAADVGVCHLEVPLTTDHGDLQGYPTFNAPAEVAAGIAATGWDVCSTASNHSLDQGFAGLARTLDILDASGVPQHDGTARTPEEAIAPVLRDVAGVQVGFVSATYGTNGIPLPAGREWSVNLIDDAAIAADAQRARDAGAELVVLSLHWGDEYSHNPSSYQARHAEAITATGLVDLIVGHHAHVIQPIVPVNGVPVAFGLGNFLSGQFQSPDRSDGVVLQATFTETAPRTFDVTIDWTPTRVDPSTYHVRPLTDPQTTADQASAARTDSYLTWDGRPLP